MAQLTSVRAEKSLKDFYENGIENKQQALKLCDSIAKFYFLKGDSCMYGWALNLKGECYNAMFKNDQAFESLLVSRDIFEKNQCGKWFQIANNYTLSRFYALINDRASSDSIAKATIASYDVDDETAKAKLYLILGTNADSLQEAFPYLDSASAISERIGNTMIKQRTLISLGTYYAMNGNYELATKTFRQTIGIAKQQKKWYDLENTYNNLAGIAQLKGDYDKTLTLIDSAIHYAGLAKDLVGMQTFRENKAYLYSILDRYEEGYNELWLANVLKDSIHKKQNYESIAEMEEKYETEKRVNQIQKLEVENLNSEVEKLRYKRNQNKLIWGGGVLFILLICALVGFFLIRKNRNNLAAKNAQIQQAVEKSDELLLNILPEEVARELKQTGAAQAKDFKDVSILFTDFVDFTQISEKLTTTELVDEINTCFQAFDRITIKHGIEKIKTIGDSYMAVAGLPQPIEDSVGSTVMAAIEMQAFVQNRCDQLKKEGKPYFEMRAGVHCGSVVAGIVGERKFQYDIWGDAVNTASRMENMSAAGKVNISENLCQRIKNDRRFVFEEREPMEVKGKGLMKMYYVHLA